MRTSFLAILVSLNILAFGQSPLQLFSMYQFKNAQDLESIEQNYAVESALLTQLDQAVFDQMLIQSREKLDVELPINTSNTIVAHLQKRTLFTSDFQIVARGERGDRVYDMFHGIHYVGYIEGEEKSLVAISLFSEKMAGIISYKGQNYNIELLDNIIGRPYITYRSEDLKKRPSFQCHTDDEYAQIEPEDSPSQHVRSAGGTIEVYLECDYQMYQDKGNVANTIDYATSLFNVVAGIFADAGGAGHGPILQISEIVVWVSPDPYGATTATNSSTVLNRFKCEARSYNGRLAHLLSTSSKNLGGIAQLPYCYSGNTSTIHAFSNIYKTFNTDLNDYSWSVNVLAHELGHNMSSPHTHACSWNGDNTQIDDCGNVYLVNQGSTPGDCYNPSNTIIPTKGTVMSYCHLNTGNGIDLSVGFHHQVAEKIIDFSNCISATHINNCKGPNFSNLRVTNLTNTSSRITCDLVDDIASYYWRYREAGGSWVTLTTVENFVVIDDLQPSAEYEYKALTFCNDGKTSGYSCSMYFTAGVTCPETIAVVGNPIDEGTYQASNQISVAGMVESGTEITLQCNNEIEIVSEFQVQANAVFIAMITDGCN